MNSKTRESKIRPFFRFLASLVCLVAIFVSFSILYNLKKWNSQQDLWMIGCVLVSAIILMLFFVPIIIYGKPVGLFRRLGHTKYSIHFKLKLIVWRFPLIGFIIGLLFDLTLPTTRESPFWNYYVKLFDASNTKYLIIHPLAGLILGLYVPIIWTLVRKVKKPNEINTI